MGGVVVEVEVKVHNAERREGNVEKGKEYLSEGERLGREKRKGIQERQGVFIRRMARI